MFSWGIDKAKNLAQVTFAGEVTIEEGRLRSQDIRTQQWNLQSGFTLLSDFSLLERMDPQCARDIEGIMDFFDQHGIARVVRIIPDPKKDIGFGIMSLFHYRKGVRIVTCETLQEAERVLGS
jgi:hypothetical protein